MVNKDEADEEDEADEVDEADEEDEEDEKDLFLDIPSKMDRMMPPLSSLVK